MIAVLNVDSQSSHAINLRAELSQFAEVVFFDEICSDDVADNCQEAEVIVVNGVILSDEMLRQLPKLKLLAILGTGFDVVDMKTAAELSIAVKNIPYYGVASVAQQTVALIMELTNRVGEVNQDVKQLGWEQGRSLAVNKPMYELSNKVVGIIGMGLVGQAVARIMAAFGSKIIAYSNSCPEVEGIDVTYLSLDDLFKQSNIISVHTRLNSQTAEMIDCHKFEMLKPNSFFINTARGGIINETDLITGLKSGFPVAAALDVTSVEPLPETSELYQLNNVIITPHIAWNSVQSKERLFHSLVNIITDFYRS